MSLAVVCASHTPLMNRGPASSATQGRVKAAFADLAMFVRCYEPDYVIQFGPDHFNGFFYDMMPSFCIGAGAVSLGDWGGRTGPLDVPEEAALALLDHMRADDFDAALSYRMVVDHGFIQMWEAMLGDFRSIPMVPIFVNAAAPPLPTYRRVRRLGESVGRFAVRTGKRVLLAASGGLSHDPPVPAIRGAASELRERLIDGRDPPPEARRLREERVLEAGALAAAGKGPCKPLNPAWDAEFMDLLRSGQIQRLDDFDSDGVRERAGRGGNEALCWVAAFAALSAAGPFTITQTFYEPIPGWIAGFATMAARQRDAALQPTA
ncbi:MAG TPA: 3-carboxyethylcatechol 2,3-dioxygenase [Reyranella sp.]